MSKPKPGDGSGEPPEAGEQAGEPQGTDAPAAAPASKKRAMKPAIRKALAEARTLGELRDISAKLKPEERDAQAVYEATERLMARTGAKAP